MRRESSKAVKRDAFLRANGACEKCGARLTIGKFQYDHEIPDGLGGEPTLENCMVKCTACHKAKTRSDVGKIAKSKRLQDRTLGIKKPRTITRWRKMNGEPVFAGRAR